MWNARALYNEKKMSGWLFMSCDVRATIELCFEQRHADWGVKDARKRTHTITIVVIYTISMKISFRTFQNSRFANTWIANEDDLKRELEGELKVFRSVRAWLSPWRDNRSCCPPLSWKEKKKENWYYVVGREVAMLIKGRSLNTPTAAQPTFF